MLQSAFSRGLAKAAQATQALVVTGGTNSGVMKMTGRALSDADARVQCLGVATWGVINGRDRLEGTHDLHQTVALDRLAMANSDKGVNLEPNHSHFIFVDNGREGKHAWGGEIVFRFELERVYCEK